MRGARSFALLRMTWGSGVGSLVVASCTERAATQGRPYSLEGQQRESQRPQRLCGEQQSRTWRPWRLGGLITTENLCVFVFRSPVRPDAQLSPQVCRVVVQVQTPARQPVLLEVFPVCY